MDQQTNCKLGAVVSFLKFKFSARALGKNKIKVIFTPTNTVMVSCISFIPTFGATFAPPMKLASNATRSSFTSAAVFKPESGADLKAAVESCIEPSPEGCCAIGQNGAIGSWDMSSVTDIND